MFSNAKVAAVFAATLGYSSASHLDNTNGLFDNFSFDLVKFKTRTNCSLDKYPEVSHRFSQPNEASLTSPAMALHRCWHLNDIDSPCLDPHMAGH